MSNMAWSGKKYLQRGRKTWKAFTDKKMYHANKVYKEIP